jgi:hypothetical protein
VTVRGTGLDRGARVPCRVGQVSDRGFGALADREEIGRKGLSIPSCYDPVAIAAGALFDDGSVTVWSSVSWLPSKLEFP